MERQAYVKWLLDEVERQERIFHDQTKDRVAGTYSDADLRNDLKKRVKLQLDELEKELANDNA